MPRSCKSEVRPKITLPSGLAEFEASLWDLKYAPKLLDRLPKKVTKQFRFLFEEAMKGVRLSESAATAARQQARFAALIAWGACLENYTIAQLQRATGYKDAD